MKFSEKLQTLRKERKMSQEQLADALEVSRQSVSKWESGTTYPEMDKLLGICKIFNCSLDDLTNDNITDININSNEKGIINPVNIILDYMKSTIDVLANMSFQEIIKCCITMFIVSLFILILRTPFEFLKDSLNEIYLNFGTRLGSFLISFTSLIINLVYLALGGAIFFYIFKLKYIDNKTINKAENKSLENLEIKEDDIKENIEEKNVTIIKNNKNSFLDVLVNVIIYFIKCILFICTLPFIITLVCLALVFILSILIIGKKIISIGLIISILSLIILNIFGLQIVYYFIFNKKINVKVTFITFIFGLLLLGIGGGTFTYELTKYKYVDEAPTYAHLQNKTYTYKMTEDLFVDEFHYFYEFEYVEDNKLKDEIKVEISYYDNYINFEAVNNDNHIYFENVDTNPTKIIENIITDISNKTLYNYNHFIDRKVIVKASSKNIEKLKNNYKKYLEEIEASEITDLENYYNGEIYRYQTYITELEEQVDKLKESNSEKDLEIEEKEQKIEEYKEKISNLLE